MTPEKSSTTAGISDAAVQKATGKTWKEWISTLDRAGCRKLDHKSIAQHVHHHHALGGWWSQMVTVGYEQATGKRQKHEKPAGFEISRSKVVNVPLADLYAAWESPARRSRWLAARPLKIRTATKNKSMRLDWIDGMQILSLNFYSRGKDKSQVALQHGKLPNARAAEKAKTYWSDTLEALKAYVER